MASIAAIVPSSRRPRQPTTESPTQVYRGTVDVEQQTKDDGGAYYNHCDICDVDRPRGALHCYDCGVCVMGLDHHCPVIGKCVGAKNIGNFQVLLGAVAANLVLITVLSIAAMVGGGRS